MVSFKLLTITAAVFAACCVSTACSSGSGDSGVSSPPPPTTSPPPPPTTSPPPPATGSAITLDNAVTYQTMTGWEATLDWEPQFAPVKDEAIDKAVEMGIDRVRLEIRSGAENSYNAFAPFNAAGQPGDGPAYQEWRARRYVVVNDNNDPNSINWSGFKFDELDFNIDQVVLPMRAKLAAKGRQLHVNLAYVAFNAQIGSRNPPYGNYDAHLSAAEYGEFVLATYLHMRDKYGFTPDTWQVILEPDNRGLIAVGWENGATIGNAINAAAARLQANGFTPRFVAPSVTDMGNADNYIDGIASVSGAMAHVSEFSYHRYGGANQSNLQAIVNRANTYGKKTAMLEWWFGAANQDVLFEDLTVGRNSAWQGRTLFTLFECTIASGVCQPGLRYPDDVRYNRKYFEKVRQGAVRIGVSSASNTFKPLAFRNTDGTRTVIVRSTGSGPISVIGLPAGTYSVSWEVSSGPGSIAPITIAAGAPLNVDVPGAGAMTISSAP